MSPERATTVLVAHDQPAFAGHFPGAPVLPGVVLLQLALDAVRAAGDITADAVDIASAKFFRPVAPGTALVIAHRVRHGGAVDFAIAAGEDRVATGTFVAHEAAG